MAKFDTRKLLENDVVKLIPLEATHFEELYAVASDSKIWEQHPNKNRYKRKVFSTFFEGAILSNGAYLIVVKATDEICGSTRFYDYEESENSILVGYTFLATKWWGRGINPAVKHLMFNTAFEQIDKIILHIGETNFRSQVAIEKLGGSKIDQIEVAYHGEPTRVNFVYSFQKNDWFRLNQ